MKNNLLLPNKYKKIGWYILIPSTVLGIFISLTGFETEWLNVKVFAILYDRIFDESKMFSFVKADITNTVTGVLFLIGAMLVGFSKEKTEDEFISELRLSSLLWSVWINYVLLFFAFIFIYGIPFFTVMVYNMFTVMIIFIARFNYILYKNSKLMSDEK